MLEAFAAVHGTTLGWLERNRRFLSALRANGFGFDALHVRRSGSVAALRPAGFAGFAPFGLVLEALIGEKHLLAGRENELSSAFCALQDLIMVFHCAAPPCWERTGSDTSRELWSGNARKRLPIECPREMLNGPN
jgi:hypothetical protein